MTDNKELSALIDNIRAIGGVVNFKCDAQGNIFSVQVSCVKGIGQHAMGPVAAAEAMRAVLAK